METEEKTPSFQKIPSRACGLFPTSVTDSKTPAGTEHLEHFDDNDLEEVEVDEREYDADQDKGPVLLER